MTPEERGATPLIIAIKLVEQNRANEVFMD